MRRADAVENILCLLRADPPFSAWSKDFESLEAAWQACARPAWMLWLLQTLGFDDARALRLFAIACATRVRSLWAGGAADAAVDLAEKVATGAAPRTALAAAYRAARKHAETLVERADFTEAVAAAAASATATVRERAHDAAIDASREAMRAASWDVANGRPASEETAWQAAELRRLVGDSVNALFVQARARTRGKLNVI